MQFEWINSLCRCMQGFGSFKTLDVLLTCIGHSHYEVSLTCTCFHMLKLIPCFIVFHEGRLTAVEDGFTFPQYQVVVVGSLLSVRSSLFVITLLKGCYGVLVIIIITSCF